MKNSLMVSDSTRANTPNHLDDELHFVFLPLIVFLFFYRDDTDREQRLGSI